MTAMRSWRCPTRTLRKDDVIVRVHAAGLIGGVFMIPTRDDESELLTNPASKTSRWLAIRTPTAASRRAPYSSPLLCRRSPWMSCACTSPVRA